ncbi:MAG: DUF4440 domain-containing protein [Planctomycetaceae bacterium]
MNRSTFSPALLALTIAAALFPSIPLAAANADDADVKQINKELDAFLTLWEKAFNAKDADRVMSLYAEQIDVIYEDNVRNRTRESLKQNFEKRFREEANRKVVITDVERLIVSPTLAIESGVWANTEGTDSSRPSRGRYSCTLQKINGKWLIIHDRSWGMPLAEGRSELRTRDPLSDRAHDFFKAFSGNDKKFLENIFTDDVEVWVNDLTINGKEAYLKRAHHILDDLYEKIQFGKLHVHTNYFSPNARGHDDKTISEIHPGPVIWSNAWFDLDVIGRTSKRTKIMRSHVDLRWQDGKIAQMVVYGDSTFMAEEQAAFDNSQKGTKAEDKTATRKEFDEFARLMTGRFASEIKLIHDWPGHEKKRGDVIAGIRMVTEVADGSAFMVTDAAGTGIGKELCVYNTATKQIESLIVFTGGTVMNVVTWKKSSDKWNWVLTGSLEDGREIKGRGYWEANDKGKQLHLISDDFTIGGKPADKLHDKYIRVK